MQDIITNSAEMETASRCLLQFDFIESAVLFGSFAEGKENKMSDIDIGIVTMKDLSLIEIGLMAARMETAFKRRADVVILNDLYRKNPLLAYEILSKGKVLFCRNRERLIELKTNTILFFLDTAPLRDAVNRSLTQKMQLNIYYDLKSASQAALRKEILTLKYSNIPSAKIFSAPCL